MASQKCSSSSFSTLLPRRQTENVPFGFRFCPTNQELIQLVSDKNNGIPLFPNFDEVDILEVHPKDLRDCFQYAVNREKYYFTKPVGHGKREKRSMKNGSHWKNTARKEEIRDDNNKVIGYMQKLSFFEGKGNDTPTHWQQCQYKETSGQFALCKIYNNKKEPGSPADLLPLNQNQLYIGEPSSSPGSITVDDYDCNNEDFVFHEGNPVSMTYQGPSSSTVTTYPAPVLFPNLMNGVEETESGFNSMNPLHNFEGFNNMNPALLPILMDGMEEIQSGFNNMNPSLALLPQPNSMNGLENGSSIWTEPYPNYFTGTTFTTDNASLTNSTNDQEGIQGDMDLDDFICPYIYRDSFI